MITALSIILFGFLLGMRHATDADHVAAVTTIMARERSVRQAALIGALWGLGHTLTVLLAGGAILWCGVVIPRQANLAFEFCVGLMLIVLGLLNLHGLFQWVNDFFKNRGEAQRKILPNEIENHPIALDRWFGRRQFYQILRPLIVGVVHGLAGSAAIALLVLPMIHNPAWAAGYLLVFGTGTIAGMMLITVAIALPLNYAAKCSARIHRRLAVASGLFSAGFGLFLVYQIGFVQGVFTK